MMTQSILTPSESLCVHDDILRTIWHTPLVRLGQISRHLPCPIYAKLELFNPVGSLKDRIAIDPGLVWLFVGLENVDDLLNALTQAMR